MMRCCSKDQIKEGTATKSPMAEREICHICPAKLSKRELEDLYFDLLQNNLELKKTVNRQSEKLKILSTKLQRMTATQKTYLGKEHQDCCSPTKALVQEQNNTIAELTNMNEQLQEHIKQLNMKLCSTKQFLKRGGGQQGSTAVLQNKTPRLNSRPGSNKNSSTSALHIKKNENDNNQMKSVSCQCLVKAITHKSRSMSTEPNVETDNPYKLCDENKCKSIMDELKLKIVNLQEELSKTHEEYSNRITRLEQEVLDLRTENEKVRSETAARKLSLEIKDKETRKITEMLRFTECQCDDLTSQLTIEKGKVAELETQVKAANITSQAVQNVEEKLSINIIKSPRDTFFSDNRDSVRWPPTDDPIKETSNEKISENAGDTSSHRESAKIPTRASDSPTNLRDVNIVGTTNSKKADDSGYAEPDTNPVSEDTFFSKALVKLNEELMSRISYLQAQLDNIKINSQTPSNVSKDLQKASIRWRNDFDDRSESCENTCRKNGLARDLNCENFENKDVVKDASSKKKNSDADNRYQIPGPIPVSPPTKQKYSSQILTKNEELTDSDRAFFQKNMNKYKDYIKSQKQKLQRLEEIDNAATQNFEQKSLQSTTGKTPSVDIKSVDITEGSIIHGKRLSSSETVPSKNINFPVAPKTMETPQSSSKNVQRSTARIANLVKKRQSGKVKVTDVPPGLTTQLDEVTCTNLLNAETGAVTAATEDVQADVNGKELENVQGSTLTAMKCDCKEGNVSSTPGKCSCVKRYSSSTAQNMNAGKRLSLGNKGTKRFSLDSQEISAKDKITENQLSLDSQPTNSKDESSEIKLTLDSQETNSQDKNTEKKLSLDPLRTSVAIRGYTDNIKSNENMHSDNDEMAQPTSIDKRLSLDSRVLANALSSRKFSDVASQNLSRKKVATDQKNVDATEINPLRNELITKVKEKTRCSKWEDLDRSKLSSPEDTFYMPSPPPVTSSPYKQDTKDEQTQLATDVNDAGNQMEDKCNEYTHVCNCPQTVRKDVSVFRSCSGTLRFRTTTDNTSIRFRRCNCPKQNCWNHVKKTTSGIQADGQPHEEKTMPLRRDSGDSIPKTYTVPCAPKTAKCSRSTSPDNTDQEISSLTDLPSEKSDKESSSTPRGKKCTPLSPGESKCNVGCKSLSPGEDKATTTYSESGTAPIDSMSEGEVPQIVPFRRSSENQENINMPETKRTPVKETTSAMKVEQALQAISLELARCRQLLQQTRSLESPRPDLPPLTIDDPRSESLMNEKPPPSQVEDSGGGSEVLQVSYRRPSGITLRKAEARPRIGDVYTPRVTFTLHIGTVVLSDEAVMNSRQLSLVLTWQFYGQNVAMCRLRPGRVVPFDFSTEYDVKLTDQFLDYLKAEQLTIKICEEGKLDVPFAICFLPLREALLHTNRRADLSLTLVAGPRMPRTADALDSRDEVGVLDVWCILRADPRLLPDINRAIAHTRLPDQHLNRSQQTNLTSSTDAATIESQINPDDLRTSADLEPVHVERLPVRDSDNFMDRGVQQLASNQARQERVRRDNYGYRDSGAFPVYRPPQPGSISSKRSSIYEVTSMDIKHPPSSMQELKPQVSFDSKWAAMESRRRSSGIIVNEVPVNIKNTTELKKALEKKYKNDPRRVSMSIKDERASDPLSLSQGQSYELYQLSSSVALLCFGLKDKSQSNYWHRRHTNSGLRAEQPSVDKYLNNSQYANLSNMMKQSETESTAEQITPSDTSELNKKYDYVSRMIGARKAAEAFKRVTIKRDDSISLATNQMDNDVPIDYLRRVRGHNIDISVLWLALKEECSAMSDPNVQRLYVAYTFLGRSGAELETPISLPKPKQYQDRCYYNFRKSFQLTDSDLPILGRMAKCRSPSKGTPNLRESIVFTVVSEPVEDPLGLNNCEDIGNAYLYLGDLLAYSAGSDSYTDVIPVRATVADDIIGVLAIRFPFLSPSLNVSETS